MLILILTIVGLILGVLGALPFFGLTGPRLHKYVKYEIGKRSRIQIVYLVFAVAMTVVLILMAIDRTFGLWTSLAFLGLILLIWAETLIDIWKLGLSQRAAKAATVVRAIAGLAVFSLLIIGSILSDSSTPLWHRLVATLGGFSGGVGILALSAYVNKKRENKLLSQKDDRDSPL